MKERLRSVHTSGIVYVPMKQKCKTLVTE
jgi:hypothetical protein